MGVGEEDGLSHYGEAEDEEAIAVDEPREEQAPEPRVIEAPPAPTQKEIHAYMATHISHQAWCDICMKCRVRSTLHRNINRGGGAGGR